MLFYGTSDSPSTCFYLGNDGGFCISIGMSALNPNKPAPSAG